MDEALTSHNTMINIPTFQIAALSTTTASLRWRVGVLCALVLAAATAGTLLLIFFAADRQLDREVHWVVAGLSYPDHSFVEVTRASALCLDDSLREGRSAGWHTDVAFDIPSLPNASDPLVMWPYGVWFLLVPPAHSLCCIAYT
jgi:hypothetical protein